ncbi:hypothetical protein H4582DRAFT_34994 [Lactarius indigo]|nr:hypothetical protein H4582DRAFT_34994 [Lactarius indigo]
MRIALQARGVRLRGITKGPAGGPGGCRRIPKMIKLFLLESLLGLASGMRRPTLFRCHPILVHQQEHVPRLNLPPLSKPKRLIYSVKTHPQPTCRPSVVAPVLAQLLSKQCRSARRLRFVRPNETSSPLRLLRSLFRVNYKASGTEMFKLGRFAEAEAAYTSAIARLPDSHLLHVPLLNNRGLSRFKTGNISGAIDDFTAVIALVGPSYHPAREAKVTREEDGAGVDLGDALGKAWRRRAEAYEGKEKWDLARQDWESIVGADFASKHRGEALSGIGRCKKMVSAGDAPDVVTSSAPRVNNASRPTKRPAPRRGPTPPSEAVVRLKQANQEAEAEEQARLELKDSVDSRLGAWKNGKETNLRALVASLDTVLWPELGWQKVGMAELVTSNQVKIRYTKAIAKLHPDKVRPFLRSMYAGHVSTLAVFLVA